MKKNYISPEILVLNANIMSELLSQSGSGSGKSEFGGGDDGNENKGGSTVLPAGDDDFEDGLSTKGSIFTWSDDYDNEYYD